MESEMIGEIEDGIEEEIPEQYCEYCGGKMLEHHYVNPEGIIKSYWQCIKCGRVYDDYIPF